MKFSNTEVVSYISIAVIAVSLFFIGMDITGYTTTASEAGVVNVTIDTSAALNFTIALLDFGNGSVTLGEGATIDSEGNVAQGTWTATNFGLTLENIGNVNVSLNLSANKTADAFIGGSSPTFEAKVSENKTGSCTGTPTFSSYEDLTTTPQIACTNFGFNDTIDLVNIDFRLFIPNNAGGAKTVGIIAIGTY